MPICRNDYSLYCQLSHTVHNNAKADEIPQEDLSYYANLKANCGIWRTRLEQLVDLFRIHTLSNDL